MGTKVSASTVSELNQKIYGEIDEWRLRPLVGDFPCVFLDGLWLKRSWDGEVKNVSVLVAFGVAQTGYREILGVSEGAKEDKASWTQFLRKLKERGSKGVQLFVSDKCLGLVENLGRVLSPSHVATLRGPFLWKRVDCSSVGQGEGRRGHAEGDSHTGRCAGRQRNSRQVAAKLREMRLARAAEIVEAGIDETLSYYTMPEEHWRCLRTNTPLERLMGEIRRRTRVVGRIPRWKQCADAGGGETATCGCS